MKKIILFSLSVLICSPHLVSAETIQLSTYYPAPFGSYDRIRLVPRGPIGSPCRVGTMYTDNADFTLRYCAVKPSLDPDDGVWGPMEGLWRDDLAGSTFLIDLTANVGIGDPVPASKLSVLGNVSIGDATYSGTAAPIEGMIVKGNVGIGTAAPANRLTVSGNADVTGNLGIGTAAPLARLTAVPIANGRGVEILSPTAGNTHFPWTDNWNYISGNGVIFRDSSNVERMRFDHISGNVRIGAVPTVPIQKLNVDGSVNLRSNGTNWGELKVGFHAATNGYYAVYAP